MSSGSIYYAVLDKHYVIKFVGEVRLTLCSSLDTYIETLLSKGDCTSVLIDLSEASYLDSTTLGLVAKFAVRAKADGLSAPVLVSTHEDVTRTLLSMGFDQMFVLLDVLPETQCELKQIPLVQESVLETQKRIIDAHKVLMSLNDANHEAFQSLIKVLEK
jgi:anti-anti-sigma factor